MSYRAVLLLASYRGFIAQRKVGLHSFKRFSSLLVEFSVSFRVADFAVVEQMPMCQRLQMAKTDDIGCGRTASVSSSKRQLPIAVDIKKADCISRRGSDPSQVPVRSYEQINK